MLLIKFQEYFKKMHSVLGPLDKFVGNHNGLVVICFEETFLVRYTDAYTLFSQKNPHWDFIENSSRPLTVKPLSIFT